VLRFFADLHIVCGGYITGKFYVKKKRIARLINAEKLLYRKKLSQLYECSLFISLVDTDEFTIAMN